MINNERLESAIKYPDILTPMEIQALAKAVLQGRKFIRLIQSYGERATNSNQHYLNIKNNIEDFIEKDDALYLENVNKYK